MMMMMMILKQHERVLISLYLKMCALKNRSIDEVRNKEGETKNKILNGNCVKLLMDIICQL